MQRMQNNKKMQAQARTGVRATAPMHVPVAVSCCFKNILAPDIPMYKADGLVNCDAETAGKQLSQRRQSLKDLLHDALKVRLAV